MRIGIDIDDVVTNTSETMKEYIMNAEDSEEIKKNMVEIMIGAPTTPCAKKFAKENYLKVFENVHMIENAKEVIGRLLNSGNEIYFITARGEEFFKGSGKITLEFLKNNNINYTEIIFDSKDKAKLCKENHIDLMIDDSVKHCEAVRNEGIKSIVFTSNVNKSIDTTVVRVDNWLELEEKIKELM